MTEFFSHLGDRINPIVVKETRQAVNSRLVAGFLLLFLSVQLVVMLLMMTTREMPDQDEIDLRAGRDVFTFVQGILLGTCLILIPAMTGVRLAIERSDVNVDLLFISSLTPRAVLLGKLVAAGALALLIFSTCAPFMTFAYVMRGLDVPTIVVVLTADYLAVMTVTMLALFIASVPANRGLRVLLGFFGFVGMCYLGAGLLALTTAFLRGWSSLDMNAWEFWVSCAGLLALILGVNGLLFVWSVALISPAAANRALPVRIYTLGFWLAAAIGFGIWSLYLRRPEPMLGWGLISCVLFSLQFIIAICERDQWGARVARRIPRQLILRMLVFFFYSGAAGGFAFGAFGAAISISGLAIWFAVIPSPLRGLTEQQPVLVLGLVLAYTYCYSLTAAVIRRLLAKSSFPPGYTWVIGVILVGCGCALPYIVRFALFEHSRYGYPDELTFLYLTNPFVMIIEAVRYTETHLLYTIAFLSAWGLTVTMVNLPWFVKQIQKFQPPEVPEAVVGAEGAGE